VSAWKQDAATVLRAGAEWSVNSPNAADTPGWTGTRKDAEKQMKRQGERLSLLQEKLFAEGRTGGTRSVLLVLQGMDTSGKGGIVRHVLGMVDPQGVAHHSFGVPTPEELSHHYLWRIRKALPPAGRIGVFDRSHYEDVLVVRVHHLVPDDPWEERYKEINAFEEKAVEAGTVIVKCALMISPQEQYDRLRERLERPDKYWKFNPSDIDERAHWNEYMEAYRAAIVATNTDVAPWYLIPADSKWYARLAITELLLGALESLKLGWPPADFNVAEQMQRLDDMGEAAPQPTA
jgi:PPK2 family polyphosphate:nucleotide phosphotransferase